MPIVDELEGTETPDYFETVDDYLQRWRQYKIQQCIREIALNALMDEV
jgi:hypothetical protein